MAFKFKLGEFRGKTEKIIAMLNTDDSESNDLAATLIESLVENASDHYVELEQLNQHFLTCLDAKYITHRNTQSDGFRRARGMISRWRMERKNK
jgi:hypothetical protein